MTRRQWLGWPLAGWVLGACSSTRKPGARAAKAAFGSAPAFWVWHRSSPLGAAERDQLRACGVHRLYWQVADCEWVGGRWRAVEIARRIATDGDPLIVPVFRMGPRAEFLANQPDPKEAPARFFRFDVDKNGELSREEFIGSGGNR